MKKFTTIFIFLILFTLLLGFFTILNRQKNTRESFPFLPPPAEQSKEYKQFQSLVKRAIELSDPTLCTQAESYTYDAGDYKDFNTRKEAQNNCYYHYAITKHDISICEQILPVDVRPERKGRIDEQYAGCIYGVQVDLNDFSEENCRKIKARHTGWYLGRCVEEVVKRTEDKSLCDEFFEKGTGGWNGCYYSVAK